LRKSDLVGFDMLRSKKKEEEDEGMTL